MNRKTDAEIVAEVLKGDRQAYGLLIDAYKGPLFNLALRMTGRPEDADDLTQETFIRAYEKLHRFDREKKFFTWLYTIGINLIRNHLKKNERERAIRAADRPASVLHNQAESGREGDYPSEDAVKRLDVTMRSLPVDMQEAILLKYHQDLTFEEIADITGDSISAVKMRVYRGLELLKSLMQEGC
ncbi:RNA polymerase sigma factor [bacterium]|nr:RNA polymerase sigma factor [bacterium]